MDTQNNSSSFPLFWNGEKVISYQRDNSSLSPIEKPFNNEINNITLPPLQYNCNKAEWLPSIHDILNSPPVPSPTFRAWSTTLLPNAFDPTSTWKPTGQPKRPRRRFHEIERKFTCNFPGCTKSYGALNHLNAHIVSRNHGSRRKAREFISCDYFNIHRSSNPYEPHTPSSSRKSISPHQNYKPSSSE